MATFDVRLISDFSGEKSGGSIAEWYSKVAWLCKLHKVEDLSLVLPLRLTGHAYKIYDQLPEDDKLNSDRVKGALFKAFKADAFTAYEQLHDRKLEQGEPVAAYLADIKRLAGLAGGLSEKTICSAFVFGLPDHVRRTSRTNSRMFDMNILELSDCARAVMADDAVHIAGAGQLPVGDARPRSAASRSSPEAAGRQLPPVCYSCGLPGHYQRGCAQRSRRRMDKHRAGAGDDRMRPSPRTVDAPRKNSSKSENFRRE